MEEIVFRRYGVGFEKKQWNELLQSFYQKRCGTAPTTGLLGGLGPKSSPIMGICHGFGPTNPARRTIKVGEGGQELGPLLIQR